MIEFDQGRADGDAVEAGAGCVESSRVIIREFVQLCLWHRVSLIAHFPPLEVAAVFRGPLGITSEAREIPCGVGTTG